MSKGEKIYLCLAYTIWMTVGLQVLIWASHHLLDHKVWYLIAVIGYATLSFWFKWANLTKRDKARNSESERIIVKWKLK